MEYEPSFWLLKLVYYWQTLIAGFLAVLAAGGTIWVAIKSADKEIAASRQQTDMAQKQIATALRLDRLRVASEDYALSALLEAAIAGCFQRRPRLKISGWKEVP